MQQARIVPEKAEQHARKLPASIMLKHQGTSSEILF